MAYNSCVHELAWIYSLLRVVAAGAPGHGPVHLLLSGVASLGFSWDPDLLVRMAEARFACSLSAFLSFSVLPLCYLGCLEDQGCW